MPVTQNLPRSPSHNRLLRFRLRTMLLGVALLALPLAWLGHEWRASLREQDLARRLSLLGFQGIQLGGPYDSWDLGLMPGGQSWWRELAGEVLGPRIVAIRGVPGDLTDLTPLADLTNLQLLWCRDSQVQDLTPLARLSRLECLYLHHLPVRDITPLAGLKNLRSVWILDTKVTDVSPLAALHELRSVAIDEQNVADIRPLARLYQLRDLSLDGAPVEDLLPLAQLPKLKYLMLPNSPVSKEQVDAFQNAAPNCEIQYVPAP
jgi:hypothetical protein